MKDLINKEVIPLYSRIASSLRNKILSGQYEPGSKLLSEERLAEHFGVSRITIRESLSHLEKEGLITRNRGKGTFVSEKIPGKKQSIYTSLLDIVNTVQKSEIKHLGIRNVKVGQTSIAKDLRTFFGLANEDPVAQIHRVLMCDRSQLHFFENFMPLELASHITFEEIVEKKALIRILQDKIGLKIGRGEMYLEAVPADPDMAKIFGCQVFDPFVRVQVFLHFPSGDPFEIVNYFM
ncbi:MAG: GntR family transcriptional regulator [Deltaproteobacteria bacterium]|nr:GntR family transcriptional regulator [Deltaproteobacteria bacterium]